MMLESCLGSSRMAEQGFRFQLAPLADCSGLLI